MLALEGAIVTLDAMGCQREIAQAILDKQADYGVALKGNQGNLREDVELFAQAQRSRQVTRHQPVEGDHGGIEIRTTTVIHEVDWMQQRHAWPGLKSRVMVESSRELGEPRYYLSSLTLPADEQGPIVRDHWAVENSLHWVLDMLLRDEANAPANFTALKHMALNLLRRPNDKLSIRARRKAAAWDDDFLASLIRL